VHDPSLFLWRALCLPKPCCGLAGDGAFLGLRLAIRYRSTGFWNLLIFRQAADCGKKRFDRTGAPGSATCGASADP
jgi:hypothetical protein